MTAPTPERRVGEGVELHLSGVRYVRTVHGDWLNAVYPDLGVHPATREALDKIARLTAEVERLKAVEEAARWYVTATTQFDEKDAMKALRAALSLPTPALEAQR